MAKQLGCQTSFISLVLSSKAHLNEDMAYLAADYLNLKSQDLQFFLILFHFEKAATQKLQFHYSQQITEILQKRDEIKSRVQSDLEVDFTQQMRFFSDWIYTAILTVVRIPEFQNAKAIADKLHVSEKTVASCISWLIENNFLRPEKDKLTPSSQRIHLASDSVLIDQHHRNWRQEAVRSLSRKSESDLHYSGALSISQTDFFKIRRLILETISEMESIVKPSPDEEVVGISFDLYKY